MPQETMRYRDLVLQVERFLKYATKGTSPDMVKRQAREFDDRLSAFDPAYEPRKVRRLRRRLQILGHGAAP